MSVMEMTIRAANPETDYDRIAELLSEVETQVITAQNIHEWDGQQVAGMFRHRMVATDADDRVIGYGLVMHHPWMPTGRFVISVIIDPALRGQGLGARLYDEALALARQQGATFLDSEVREGHDDWLRFAGRRGFSIDHHMFESAIDLHTFDESRFAGAIEAVEAQGIRLFSLAEAGFTTENLYKLWEVNTATALDDPSSTGRFPSFDEFQEIIKAAWFRPDGQILAAEGDTYVGLSAVGYFASDNSANNMMTGVLKPYRGRGIALAMKLRSIRAAKSWGADRITTNNDSTNAPMLAINRKLGYVPKPGIYRLVNDLTRLRS